METAKIGNDFTSKCRCCMGDGSYDIFTTSFENESLAKILSICINQRVSKSDVFPKNICSTCLQSLVGAYLFRDKVMKTQQALLSISKVVTKAKVQTNGNVSKDHTYYHGEEVIPSQQFGQQPLIANVKVKVENPDDYMDQMLEGQMKLENNGMQVQYLKQNGEDEEQQYWLQEVQPGEDGYLVPTGYENDQVMSHNVPLVNNLNYVQLPEGLAYFEGDPENEAGAQYQTIHVDDEGNMNFIHDAEPEIKEKEKIHICRICNEAYATSKELNNHAKLFDHAQRCCNTCSEAFHSFSALIQHCMDTSHRRPPMFKCPYCFKKYDNKIILQSHVKNHVKTRNIMVTKDKKGNLGCQICRTIFVNVVDLRQHYKENQETHLTCHICLQKFTNTSKLEEHLSEHESMKPLGCEICGARFNKLHKFQRHLQQHTENQTFFMENQTLYKCQFCSDVYEDEATMMEHQKIHGMPEDNKSHYCNDCGKQFTTAGFLRKHIERFHLGSEYKTQRGAPFECEVCGKILSCKATLYSHMKNVHDKTQKSFTCEICGKILKTKTSLELHTNFHNGHCPFKCHICGKAFTNATTLKSHSMIHSNERPYECSVCEKTFKQKPHLTTHILTIHTGLKLFKCDYCEKTFALKGNLSQHLKTHTGCESPYVCTICNKSFYFASRLRKHEKIHLKQ